MIKQQRNWLITGCSSGLGYALAKYLITSGEQVFATARNAKDLNKLVEGHDNAYALTLDVTCTADIEGAIEFVNQHGGVDVLVNNAGYGYIAAIEEADEKDYRQLFETNLFGLIALTRKVLPSMRKKGSGHIINISSIGGMIGNPGSGFYAATKFAVIGFSESLSKEVESLGIKVTAVLPGPFRTDWAGRSLQAAKHPIEAYKETVHDRVKSLNQQSGQQVGDPIRAAKAIIYAVNSAHPPLHLVLGKPGLEMVQEKIVSLSDELTKWTDITLSADYPD
ncbi:SDR family NAD(P)-dependent oxidoreductase [Entomomonas moraniae]|uniref:SDR family NAD(P)-dependent oxidoreductase n=1 Tax=Entomomonas moraniae TaxID=2213226 RepID=A0A3Q9JI01_9GAMM|nr:oxidoreductase [Entomomonas moraniae]AZS49899.1 SDR family NAD(P)-dependent oxidoreductase [Entomomonas moraniae]